MIKDRQTHVEMGKNKKERQSFDALSFCTRSGNDLRAHFVRLDESRKVGLLNNSKVAPIRQSFLFLKKTSSCDVLHHFAPFSENTLSKLSCSPENFAFTSLWRRFFLGPKKPPCGAALLNFCTPNATYLELFLWKCRWTLRFKGDAYTARYIE